MAKRKTFRAPVQLKADGEDGTFRSVFATFNVVDHDGDVTVPGAFRDGQSAVIEGWNHDYGLPVGKGTIHADDEKAWIDGQFFLDTVGGAQHYKVLKGLDGLEEWSYTFDVEDAEMGEKDGERVQFLKGLDVWGVAPVTRGAGVDTRTLTLKSAAGLTEEDVRRLKAFLKSAPEDGGLEQTDKDQAPLRGSGTPEGDGEGQVEPGGRTPANSAGSDNDPTERPTRFNEPSGVGPGVVLAEIEIMDLEEG